MPWIIATLRGQKVYARVTLQGDLALQGGRVEVRYKPHDGRAYAARPDNLTPVDTTPLPDDTCGPAEAAPPRDKDAATAGAAGKGGAAKAGGRGAPPKAGPIPEGAVIAYTDGACSGNPGPAGLGVVVLDGGKRVEVSEYLGHGTNNIAELTALLRALEEVADAARPIVLHTDSQYAIGVLQKGWKAKANVELVATIKRALAGRAHARIVYVPGHSGVPLNERCDELARAAITSRRTARTVVG